MMKFLADDLLLVLQNYTTLSPLITAWRHPIHSTVSFPDVDGQRDPHVSSLEQRRCDPPGRVGAARTSRCSGGDVLHEGPVPQGLSLADLSEVRANFIHSRGWAAEASEVINSFSGSRRRASIVQGSFGSCALVRA